MLRNILGFCSNPDNLVCPLCKKLILKKKGIILNNCKHSFCKNCFLTLYAKYKDSLLYCPDINCSQLVIDSSIKEKLEKRRKEKLDKQPNNNWLCHICEIRNALILSVCKFCDTPKHVKPEYEELLALENSNNNLVPNFEKFDCSICFGSFKAGEGVIIRNCFHTFCKECLINFIKASEVSDIKCPEIDCEFLLQDREIRAILPTIDYENYLRKGLNIAENQSSHSFHCKTPNCNVWWINDENTNIIKCQVCCKINCISCSVCFNLYLN